MLEPTPWPPPGPMALIMSSLVYVDLCGVGGHGGIGRKGDNESRFRDILDRVSRYVAGYVDTPLFNRNYMLSDLFQTQQNQSDSILIMAANNSNGLSVLQEIDRDGVELRLVNSNNLNNNTSHNSNNSNNNLNQQQQTMNSQSSSTNRNDSIDDGDLVSLSGESSQMNNTNSENSSGQLLSTNGLESLVITSINSNSNSNSNVRRSSNGHLPNQTISIIESSANANNQDNHETTRVITRFLKKFFLFFLHFYF